MDSRPREHIVVETVPPSDRLEVSQVSELVNQTAHDGFDSVMSVCSSCVGISVVILCHVLNCIQAPVTWQSVPDKLQAH